MEIKLEPISTIKANLGIEQNGKVQKFFTNTCYRYMDKYVPRGDTGLLRETVALDTDTITYEMPYAHYQYIGKLYVDPITKKGAFYSEDYGFWSRPGVKKERTETDLVHTNGFSYWDVQMWSVEKDKVCDEVEKYIAKGGK